MGTDDLFKKKRAKQSERKSGFREPKPNSFLIVTEGKKTEPLYFDGLAEYINQKYGNSISVKTPPLITTQGEGKNTLSLVRAAEKLASCAPIRYSQVWVVFDKDDFHDFDDAIQLAEEYGFHSAWSNQSFEYWIYLHFSYSDSALHRNDWYNKLNQLFKAKDIHPNGYTKNNPNIFRIVTTYGSLRNAVENAERANMAYDKEVKPSLRDPCTTVHLLVKELETYLGDLLDRKKQGGK